MKTKQKYILFSSFFLAVVLSLAVWGVSALEDTNIDSQLKFAWSENGGWLNFGSEDGNVMVNDTELTGYAWSENLGWISLNCSNNNICATSNYKVANDGEGNLSGYAWGENIGFLNFAPSDGGVAIDSSGNFSGYAWGENIGWIIFNCQDVDACDTSSFKVKTSWLPLSAREDDEDDSLEISDVRSSSTDNTVVINWKTNHNADSKVRWGKDKNLEKEKNDNEKEKRHRIVLRELESNTEYFFRVKSTDGDDESDNSRIHSVSTKPASAIFAKRSWESFNKGENKDNYEKVDIEVSDKSKNEERRESLSKKEEEKNLPEKTVENIESNNGNNFISNTLSSLGEKISSATSGFRKGLIYVYNGAYNLALGGQRKVAGFFDQTGEQISSVYGSLISQFNKEKAAEIARLNQAKFFTAQVFSRDEKKLLSEMRFQILDKSDNPVPNLETMLFSEPQSSVTDENGVASFRDVPIGSHTLAFNYNGENFEKKVAIADTLTDEGKVRAEVVQVKAEKEKIAVWMWLVIIMLIISLPAAAYFGVEYYKLKNRKLNFKN